MRPQGKCSVAGWSLSRDSCNFPEQPAQEISLHGHTTIRYSRSCRPRKRVNKKPHMRLIGAESGWFILIMVIMFTVIIIIIIYTIRIISIISDH